MPTSANSQTVWSNSAWPVNTSNRRKVEGDPIDSLETLTRIFGRAYVLQEAWIDENPRQVVRFCSRWLPLFEQATRGL
jgi:hypothetical protein